MKFFSTFLTAVSVALLGVVGTMAQTSDQVITAIQSFITVSRNLDTQVTGLNAINFPTMDFVCLPRNCAVSFPSLLSQIIADGFNNITTAVNTFNAEFSVSIHIQFEYRQMCPELTKNITACHSAIPR